MHAFAPRLRLLALGVALAVSACSRDAAVTPLPAGSRVLALGDSLTYGTGATPQTAYPAALAAITGWQVDNAGVPGEIAAQVCARAPEAIAASRPALVLVLAGGNDFLRRLPDAGLREALAACIAHARHAGVPVVLMPVPRLGLGGLDNARVYADVAGAHGVPLVDPGLAGWLRSPALRADAVHLNADGYRAMARRIADGLADVGYAAR